MFQEQQHKLKPVLWLLMIKLSNDAYGRLLVQEYFGVNAPKGPHHSIQLFTSAITYIQHSFFFSGQWAVGSGQWAVGSGVDFGEG
ncbi:hypothetical protein VNO78_15474 [Psophocarpus tetragonolobus]|uniref:Uncharacterized protein n=1 Tax=Psophocarpus tetragonolobus TaxID=3891 RepID=A0AAN9XJY3_PSOTE